MQGIAFAKPAVARQVCEYAYEKGLIVETSGAHDEVVKCLCPLTISEADLHKGLDILADAVQHSLHQPVSIAS